MNLCGSPNLVKPDFTSTSLRARRSPSGANPENVACWDPSEDSFSTTWSELREQERTNRKTGKKETVYVAPVWSGHVDFANPFEFTTFMRTMMDLEFDVMLESKAKDLALIRLRLDLLPSAPEIGARFGTTRDKKDLLQAEEAALLSSNAWWTI